MQQSPILGLTLMSASQAQKETVFNEFLIAMDALFRGSVLSASLNTPPGRPNPGDAYIVAAWRQRRCGRGRTTTSPSISTAGSSSLRR